MDVLPWEPLCMFLPRVVSWLPVPQPSIAVETFDVVTVTCQDKDEKTKTNQKKSLWICVILQSDLFLNTFFLDG